MTRDEIVALCERVAEKIKRNGVSYRPITDARKARFDELKRQHEGKQHD
jgi:hypothetical protein